MTRPETTLFMLMSLDGKISTGDTDILDFDQDLKDVAEVGDGLSQYYDLEQQTDQVSFNTGRVMAKIGVNERVEPPCKMDVDFVILDNRPHLTAEGIRYLSAWTRRLYLATSNPRHAAHEIGSELGNVTVINVSVPLDLPILFHILKSTHNIERLTIQSGGMLNATLLRQGLIDHLSIVIAPVLIGGNSTPTLMDGEPLHSPLELFNLRPLKLTSNNQLDHSYLHVRYDVIN